VRTTIFKLVQAFGSTPNLPCPIYEFGAKCVAGQEALGNVRECFGDKDFITSDASLGPGVDKVLDLHKIDLDDAAVGTAILLDTIEHVERPWQALQEIYRVMKPGGMVLMTSVMFFPIHFFPDDYWRFTESGFRALLAPFDDAVLASCGPKKLPHTIVGIGFKAPVAAGLKSQLAGMVEEWGVSGGQSWREAVLITLPPFLLSAAYELRAAWLARAAKKP
jgi:SAM-dependent methyltransferase